MNVTILGAGSWGTTIALLLAKKSVKVTVWEFRRDAAERMQRERVNDEFLPGFSFPENLCVTGDIGQAVAGADIIISVVPSHAVRATALQLREVYTKRMILVSATKGIEQGTYMRMSEVFADVLHSNFDINNFVCVSGPSHAEEVSLGLPTSVVAASPAKQTSTTVQKLMSGKKFRVYSSDDLTGVELGGSLKNVVALAAGISHGLGFGDNTLGALLTRGLTEITRLGVHLGGKAQTFAGLSGMGDLVTTCCSRHSRNRHVGEQIGKGRKLKEILSEMIMVAEGVKTTKSAFELSQRENVMMPITEQIHAILFKNADPLKATVELMTRTLKVED